jgi:predicted MFS family arabinose efflux permease
MSRKIIVAALTALTLVTTLAASSGQAQAKNWGAFGVGVAAGALVGAAATSHAYGYYGEPVHHCRFVARYDAWGNYVRTVRVCGW